MNRITVGIVSLAIPAAMLTADAVAQAGAPAAGAAQGTKVQLRQTGLGKILVDPSGSTLYMFTQDAKNKDKCVKISGCSGTWPVLRTHGKPSVGKGLKSSLLSTITLAHGVKQVTYAGHPLYRYKFSGGPGDTSYVGAKQFGGSWYALNAGGHTVKQPAMMPPIPTY